MDLESASETPQGKGRMWEALDSLAGESQAYMLTRAEEAEREPSGSTWPLGALPMPVGTLCATPGLIHRPVA